MYLLELWFSLDICPGVGLLDHMVALFLVFKGNSIFFSIVALPVYIPTNSDGGVPFLHILSSIYCFDDSHSDCGEVKPHCSFYLHNIVLEQRQKYRSMEQDRKPRYKPTQLHT